MHTNIGQPTRVALSHYQRIILPLLAVVPLLAILCVLPLRSLASLRSRILLRNAWAWQLRCGHNRSLLQGHGGLRGKWLGTDIIPHLHRLTTYQHHHYDAIKRISKYLTHSHLLQYGIYLLLAVHLDDNIKSACRHIIQLDSAIISDICPHIACVVLHDCHLGALRAIE